MADFSRQSVDLASSQGPPPTEGLAKMSLGNQPPAPAENGGAPPANGAIPAAAPGASTTTGGAEVSKPVREVLESDIGVSTMLNRLKQSIVSAKEFAQFLKKRSILEDEQAKGMKKLCRMTQENIHHADQRQGSFAHAYEEMISIHDRMADNGQQFAVSLHQMHDDLLEVASIADKHRKGWKQSGLAAEQRLVDIEMAMRKSKSKYDSLAEDYDRVRTGEARQGGKMFGLKGPKSAAQQEEDLLRKVQAADTDYMGKVQAYQSEKATMVSTTRPEAIRALQDLIRECDSGTTLQMQKFASFNEKLLLSNGLVISPLKSQTGNSRSLKEVIQAVNNNKDLDDYVASHHGKLPTKTSEPQYERNPVLNPPTSMSMSNMTAMHQQQIRPQSQQPQPPQQISQQQTNVPPQGSLNNRQGNFDMSSPPVLPGPGQGYTPAPAITAAGLRPGSQPGHERSFSHGGMLNQAPPQLQEPSNQRNSTQPVSTSNQKYYGNGSSLIGSIGQAGPPQLGALPFQKQQQPQQQGPSPSPPRQTGPYQPPDSARPVSPPSAAVAPNPPVAPSAPKGKQVYGVSLNRLYERDGLAVPMVVYQCIQAVDLYGLAVEGIYRISGSAPHIQKLKNMFDTDSDSRNLDFRNPENFFHDVNSVAGLLKQFFRDLPDPLLTGQYYSDFIDAAKVEDDVMRRDSLHAIINSLPDPNYATLRALTLHLNRVIENSANNRMNSQNLAIVFGPTLMGNAQNGNIADAGWQSKVIDTILQNTYQIFDED